MKNILSRVVSHHEEGFVHIAFLSLLLVAFLIGVGVLIGYAIWAK